MTGPYGIPYEELGMQQREANKMESLAKACQYCSEMPDVKKSCQETKKVELIGGAIVSAQCSRYIGHEGKHVACGTMIHEFIEWIGKEGE